MSSQRDKAARFAQLHTRAGAFIIPNPWDVGTARLLEHLGFEALATTSAGYAFSVGRVDNTVGRDETLAHAAALAGATRVPLSADLENGFGDAPEMVAETIRLAAAAGIVGGSIEDLSRSRDRALYDVEHAAERVRAAAETARSLSFRFTLTARAENFIAGKPDLRDTIERLQAYQAAGADALFAPGLRSADEIATVVRSVDAPVNVVMGLQGARLSVAELTRLGVKRISVGSALARAALGAFLRGAREMRDDGTFAFAEDAVSYQEITRMFVMAPEEG